MLYGSVLDKNDAFKYLLENNPNYKSAYNNLYAQQTTALKNLDSQYYDALAQQYYNNLKSDDAILSSNYGTGMKNELLERNKQALQDAYMAYQQQYLVDKQELNSTYSTALDSLNNALNSETDYMANTPNELYGYLQYLDEQGVISDDDLFSRFYSTNDDGVRELLSWQNLTTGLSPDKYYETGGQRFQYEAMIDKDGNLTDYGRDVFGQLLAYNTTSQSSNNQALSFGAYLTNKNEELANWLNASDANGMSNYDKFLQYAGMKEDAINSWKVDDYQRQLYTKDLGRFDTRTKASAVEQTVYNTIVKDGGKFTIDDTSNNLFSYFDDDGLSNDAKDFVGYNLEIVGNSNGWTPEEWYKNGKATKLVDDKLAEGQVGWEHNRRKTFVDAAKKAQAGELPNYTIIDVNRGKGTNYYIYLNGKFYNVHLRNKDDKK